MERRDYVAFLDAACGYAPGEYFKFLRDLDSPALDFLNVRYAVAARGAASPGPRWQPAYSGADGLVFENPDVMPRVFAPGTVRSIGAIRRGSVQDAFRAFRSEPAKLLAAIDFHRDALVVSDGDTPIAAAVRRDNAAVISSIREGTNAVAFTAAAPASGAVAVVTVVQDGGWRARDEQGPLAAGRANGPFFAVALRPGTHRVTVAYLPPGLRAGAAISAGTLLAAALGTAIAARRRRFRAPV